MTKFRLTLAAVLLAGASLPALAVDTKPVINPGASSAREATMAPNHDSMSMQNNGMNDMNRSSSRTSSRNMRASARMRSNTQTAMNTSNGNAGMGISSEPSSTQRRGMHLSKAQERRADRAEAQTTRELNQQAAAMAAPSNS